jgi:hypothetical protein
METTRWQVVIYNATGFPIDRRVNFSRTTEAEGYAARKREEFDRRGWNMTVVVEPDPFIAKAHA